MGSLEKYFQQFRKNIIGINSSFISPYGKKEIIYADWIASGRLYGPIEDRIRDEFGPFVANTHTETSETGTMMTYAYHYSHKIIKNHVNAGPEDVIITAGTGMTSVINKFQRILGLKTQCKILEKKKLDEENRPIIFVTHMEHHSNQTSWYETIADVVVLEPNKDLGVDLDELEKQLKKYKKRKFKIGSFSACSNVTGIKTPYHQMAKIIHRHGGICFVDFAASAPYTEINMHPEDPEEQLDAIFFSPHKFLGGPGSSGVLIFNRDLYNSKAPDHPGGGTVDWTNPWGKYKYIDDIELREDGGTPGFIQSFRAALSIKLKEKMGVQNMEEREKELTEKAFSLLEKVPGIKILADHTRDRLGVLSFYIENVHYNLIVKLLSDRFGIQVRGGCACAGTYGHYLLNVTYDQSKQITDKINKGDLSEKPGWVRLSLHPTMKDKELEYIADGILKVAENIDTWAKDYEYSPSSNEFYFKKGPENKKEYFKKWFDI
ncbi:MAG: aminotransferase class V-fold PLP-dependent enzyme [Acidobacteriota bacterium]